jgi:hypothetical protein
VAAVASPAAAVASPAAAVASPAAAVAGAAAAAACAAVAVASPAAVVASPAAAVAGAVAAAACAVARPEIPALLATRARPVRPPSRPIPRRPNSAVDSDRVHVRSGLPEGSLGPFVRREQLAELDAGDRLLGE